jgi:hypothetical protein
MARSDKRKVSKEIRSVVRKGKEAMYSWIIALGYEPTDIEIRAWQSGYVAGLNNRQNH